MNSGIEHASNIQIQTQEKTLTEFSMTVVSKKHIS